MSAPGQLLLPPDPATDQEPPRTEHRWIHDLGEAGYEVLRAIPVEIRRVEVGDHEAFFLEANIAMSGRNPDDAFRALVAEILDTFDLLRKERKLGPDAAEQCQVLHRYIVRS